MTNLKEDTGVGRNKTEGSLSSNIGENFNHLFPILDTIVELVDNNQTNLIRKNRFFVFAIISIPFLLYLCYRSRLIIWDRTLRLARAQAEICDIRLISIFQIQWVWSLKSLRERLMTIFVPWGLGRFFWSRSRR